MLLDRRCPVNVGMEQPLQARPVATLNRIEHVAYRWNLLGHSQNVNAGSTIGWTLPWSR